MEKTSVEYILKISNAITTWVSPRYSSLELIKEYIEQRKKFGDPIEYQIYKIETFVQETKIT